MTAAPPTTDPDGASGDGYDRDTFAMIAQKARNAMAADAIEAIADMGYYMSEEIVGCEEAGSNP